MNETTKTYAPTVRFSIPQAVIETAAEQRARAGNYSSVEKTGGFKVSGVEKTLPELRGIVDDFAFYQAKFEGGKFLKREAAGAESEGYQNRCDLYLKITDEYTTTLSLSKTSTAAALNYFLSLKGRSISPCDVVTKITTRPITGKFGSYSIAVFESCESGRPQSQPMKNVTPAQITDVQPASTPPPAAPTNSQIPSAWL